MNTNLQTLLDLPDVRGLFCLQRDSGSLLINRLPAPYVDDIFAALGKRIKTLFDAVDANYKPTSEYLINLYEESIFLKSNGRYIIGVLCGDAPNLPGLRIASNLGLSELDSIEIKEPEPKPKQLSTPAPIETRRINPKKSSASQWGDPDETEEEQNSAPKKKKKTSNAFDGIWG